MEDAYPGYNLDRRIAGALLPDHRINFRIEGVRYDDELPVNWAE